LAAQPDVSAMVLDFADHARLHHCSNAQAA